MHDVIGNLDESIKALKRTSEFHAVSDINPAESDVVLKLMNFMFKPDTVIVYVTA